VRAEKGDERREEPADAHHDFRGDGSAERFGMFDSETAAAKKRNKIMIFHVEATCRISRFLLSYARCDGLSVVT
jgi:hypothetical protein